MKQYKIGGKERICFVITKGEVADVVVPYDNLAPVDQRRVAALESKGGELMMAMREEVLDNGVNALVMFQDVFITVPHEVAVVVEDEKDFELHNTNVDENETPTTKKRPVVKKKAAVKKKRGRGRPPKA